MAKPPHAPPSPDRGPEAVEAALAAIERIDPKLQSFCLVDAGEARAAARSMPKAGRGGPLAGLPIAIKDIIDVAGHPTRAGSLTRAQVAPADRDAHCVERLRAAGAVIVGKTHTVEYAYGGWGTNHAVGTPRNPWDAEVQRTPGGSSSGTGAAVGAGLVPAALGSDTGGSVRLPASFCGCVGLKTSIGLIGRSGVVPLSDSLDTVGPLATSVRLAAELLAVMQGHDPDDPSTHGVPPVDPLGDLERGARGLRIGRLEWDQMPLLAADVRADFERAIMMLAESGATVVPFRLPQTLAEYTQRCNAIIAPEGYATYRALVDDPASKVHPDIRARMVVGRTMTAADVVIGQRQRRADIAAYLAAMDRLDAVVLPTTPTTAIPVAEVDEGSTPAFHTRFVNYLALAALSVPIGLTPSGLPSSLQIVVRRLDDALALRIGHAFESTRGTLPSPPLAAR